jgi:hypothetical protein
MAIGAWDAFELPGPQAFLVLAGLLLLWFVDNVLYWWWAFLFKGIVRWKCCTRRRGRGSGHQGTEELEYLASGNGARRWECSRINQECKKGAVANALVVWMNQSAGSLDCLSHYPGLSGDYTNGRDWDLAGGGSLSMLVQWEWLFNVNQRARICGYMICD